MATPATTIGLPSPDVRAAIQEEEASAQEWLEVLDNFDIREPEDFEMAANALREIKAQKKALETQRKSVTGDLHKALTTIRSWFKPSIQLLEKGEFLLKRKIAEANQRNEKERQKALAKAGEAAMAGDASKASAAMQKAHGNVTPTMEGVSLSTKWTYRVTDFSKVPLKYMMVDDAAVMAEVKRGQGETEIPGIEVFAETAVRASTKG